MLIDECKVMGNNLPSTLEKESYRSIVMSCPRFCSDISVFYLYTLMCNLDRVIYRVIGWFAIFYSNDVPRNIVAVAQRRIGALG